MCWTEKKNVKFNKKDDEYFHVGVLGQKRGYDSELDNNVDAKNFINSIFKFQVFHIFNNCIMCKNEYFVN